MGKIVMNNKPTIGSIVAAMFGNRLVAMQRRGDKLVVAVAEKTPDGMQAMYTEDSPRVAKKFAKNVLKQERLDY